MCTCDSISRVSNCSGVRGLTMRDLSGTVAPSSHQAMLSHRRGNQVREMSVVDDDSENDDEGALMIDDSRRK
jgi:hypothetical protein